jgi:hypothetical protein
MQIRVRKDDPRVIPLDPAPQGCADYDGLMDEARGRALNIDQLSCLARYPVNRAVPDYLTALANADPDPDRQRHRMLNVVSYFVFLGDGAVETLCSELGGSSPDGRRMAAFALSVIGSAKAVQCLVDAVSNGDPPTRSAAAGAWRRALASGHVKPDDHAWLLERRLLGDSEPLVRLNALYALDVFDPDAVQPLIPTLLADGDPAVKGAAEGLPAQVETARRWIGLYGEDRP